MLSSVNIKSIIKMFKCSISIVKDRVNENELTYSPKDVIGDVS